MSKRTYEEYIKNDCHPVGYNEPCQSYYFGQTSVDLLLDKIDQLKQQNEELMLQLSKYEIEKHKPAYCTLAGTECEYLGNVHELKQQLAEKDKEINSLIVDYEKRISHEQELMSNMEHRLTEKQNTIDEINKEFVQAVHDWKTLCAEKDKEIAHLKEMDNYHLLYELAGADETIANLKKQLKEKDKDKTQLAIQELEKVKNFVDGRTYCADYINKRMQDLKGE